MDGGASPTPPKLAACFIIRFDKRIGYKLAWSRSIPGCDLENSVEFKSLPSGLHNVREDIIFFVHDQWAGLSAFRNEPSTEEDRNAAFVSVGILVPSQNGRLGRAWLHQGNIKQLAGGLLNDKAETTEIEKFWDQNRMQDEATLKKEPTNPSLANTDKSLPQFHPVLLAKDMLDVFGPLIFPLYKAALLRKRILFIASPPLHMLCNYVFILSVISSIPSQTLDKVEDDSLQRSQSLFSIGVHDIPKLESSRADEDSVDFNDWRSNWIACTSDELLSTKDQLYDVKVVFPVGASGQRRWPTLQLPGGAKLRATRRDFRRFKHMQEVLEDVPKLPTRDHTGALMSHLGNAHTGDTTPILNLEDRPSSHLGEVLEDRDAIEPQAWAEIVYDSFMWWASAGERSAALDSEYEQDVDLLGLASEVVDESDAAQEGWNREGDDFFGFSRGCLEMSLVAYFFQLTDIITSHIDALSQTYNAATEGESQSPIYVYKEDLEDIGLDTWSESDRQFLKDFIRVYFNRNSSIQGSGIECCGVKIV